jgi:hypothetical protein
MTRYTTLAIETKKDKYNPFIKTIKHKDGKSTPSWSSP